MKKGYLRIMTTLMLGLMLCGCSLERFSPEYKVTEVTQAFATAEELQRLYEYPNLVTADVRGSDCYDAILSFIEANPQVEVTYDVELSGQRLSMDTSELTLVDGSFDVDELLTKCRYLPDLKSISLPLTTLELEQIQRIRNELPNAAVDYTVSILGEETAMDVQSLDLSSMVSDQVDTAIPGLRLLTGLNHIQLMDAQGESALAVSDVKKLVDSLPQVTVNYSFQLFGVDITTADERVEFLNVPIGNEGIPQIRDALDILPNCTYFLMDTCGVDNEIMAQLREDYADRTKVVWRVWLVKENYHSKYYMRCGSYLTDTHRIRTNLVTDQNIHVLNYCNETKYVDVGHVLRLTRCDFLAYMPDLEVCIIAITGIKDITPLANHDKLEYLEVFDTRVADITPLASCPNIEHLNLSSMDYLDDVTTVHSLKKLKRLRIVDSALVTDEEKEQLKEVLPDCKHMYSDRWASGGGWRYIGGPDDLDPRYALLREQMEYVKDHVEYGIL